jgi:hypothetical protein
MGFDLDLILSYDGMSSATKSGIRWGRYVRRSLEQRRGAPRDARRERMIWPVSNVSVTNEPTVLPVFTVPDSPLKHDLAGEDPEICHCVLSLEPMRLLICYLFGVLVSPLPSSFPLSSNLS